MAAAAKSLPQEDMFDAARRTFFSNGDASVTDSQKARETTFAKEVPSEPGPTKKAEAAAAMNEQQRVLIHA